MSKVPKDWQTPQGDLLRDLKEAEAEIARLRAAIKSEAKIHAKHRSAPNDKCTCRICRIDREEP